MDLNSDSSRELVWPTGEDEGRFGVESSRIRTSPLPAAAIRGHSNLIVYGK